MDCGLWIVDVDVDVDVERWCVMCECREAQWFGSVWIKEA